MVGKTAAEGTIFMVVVAVEKVQHVSKLAGLAMLGSCNLIHLLGQTGFIDVSRFINSNLKAAVFVLLS